MPMSDGEHSEVPVNWPDSVVFLEDYYYHLAIDQTLLDVIQTGAHLHTADRRTKPTSFPVQPAEDDSDPPLPRDGNSGANDYRIDSKQETCENDGHSMAKEHDSAEAHPKTDESNNEAQLSEDPSLADEYLELPLGDAIAGTALGTLHPKTQTPLFEIRLITSPASHPALGSHGLFACQALRPGTHLLDYISEVAPDHVANPDSDHTLYLMRDLNLDASYKGNQARFVNDFRGIRSQEQGPNLGWDLYCDRRTGQVRMGGKVLKRIRKDEEIVCSYGKAFWRSRGIKVQGNDWEDAWDTDLDDWSSSDEAEEKQLSKKTERAR
ncbi:hypothetical protein BGZ73_001333 [Actinomortierella ambigua]|nr:hypothetical protein BGZ73_001333 [Actinomortierella ambigua]